MGGRDTAGGDVVVRHRVPDIAGVTWTLQLLPLFSAAGALTNRGSGERHPEGFHPCRLVRLGVPARVYTAFWTAIGLPAAHLVPGADLVGRSIDQLLCGSWASTLPSPRRCRGLCGGRGGAVDCPADAARPAQTARCTGD
ncbi:MAG: hypothetical protein ACQERF_07590 [Actinomycetota bacterium]